MDNWRLVLKNVYQQTMEYCRNAKLPVEQSILYSMLDEEFSDKVFFPMYKPYDSPAEITVENIDSFDMAKKIGGQNGLVMVLNMASDSKAGGGVLNGAKAQEEDLFRKSNYFQVLPQSFYPLTADKVIYSPLVHIIKDSNYKLLNYFPKVSCLAVAAIKKPKLSKIGGNTTYANPIDLKIMEKKIDMIFKVAIKHGHEIIVLGALGCGAYGNPPEEVAKLFSKAVEKYKYYFKKIGFAVLSGYGNSNYDIFRKYLTQ